MNACRICSNADGNTLHSAREMMFGTRERFDYIECGACGTVSIAEIPVELGRFYPAGYYSLGYYSEPFLKRLRRAFRWFTGREPFPFYWLPKDLSRSARILDIGCGDGRALYFLRTFGFRHLAGSDPLVKPRGGSIPIYSGNPPGLYDFIMYHHSLEHIPDVAAELRKAKSMLAPGGRLIVRIPVIGDAWDLYGVDWVQLDPPRHLYLFTPLAFQDLAARCGLRVERVVYDSTAFQFWGSEQYRKDVELAQNEAIHIPHKMFSPTDLLQFKARAEELNRLGRGDQACFYLAA